ncbi:potassium-transporting ATPase subunit KdpA [Streptomyces spororaveus]|uniref:potassium-transporting ATPase subunit KdpA n=1 Tax=Streptomyces spororaveus TaxID=284039 RepID=UPI0027E295A2|nr:potassium-transporting ATPase subunit KdpA [Streptomyces spororaveus]
MADLAFVVTTVAVFAVALIAGGDQAVTVENVVGLVVAVSPARYLVLALVYPERVLSTAMSPVTAGVLQLARADRRAGSGVPSPGRLHGPVYSSEKHHKPEKWISKAIGATPSAEMRWPRLSACRPRLLRRQRPLPLLIAARAGHLPGSLASPSIDRTRHSTPPRRSWREHQLGSSYSGEQARATSCRNGGLAVQNFVSAAVAWRRRGPRKGLRALPHRRTRNFWADLVRGTVAICCRSPSGRTGPRPPAAPSRTSPASTRSAVPGWHAAVERRRGGLAGRSSRSWARYGGRLLQRQLGPHPFENPTPFSNLFEVFLILVIPFAMTRTFGRLVGNLRQGYAILATMGRHLGRLHA